MLADTPKPSFTSVRGSPTAPPCVVAPLGRVSSVEPLSTTTTSHGTLLLMNDSESKHRLKRWARFLVAMTIETIGVTVVMTVVDAMTQHVYHRSSLQSLSNYATFAASAGEGQSPRC